MINALNLLVGLATNKFEEMLNEWNISRYRQQV
jgi:hypothetical protein